MTEHYCAGAPDRARRRRERVNIVTVAHGTSLNDNSAPPRAQVQDSGAGRYASVLNVYMEELPRINWAGLTKTRNDRRSFFISDGLHSYEDIPALLGIDGETEGPHQLHGRTIFYSTAMEPTPDLVDVIIEQAANFDKRKQVLQPVLKFSIQVTVQMDATGRSGKICRNWALSCWRARKSPTSSAPWRR